MRVAFLLLVLAVSTPAIIMAAFFGSALTGLR